MACFCAIIFQTEASGNLKSYSKMTLHLEKRQGNGMVLIFFGALVNVKPGERSSCSGLASFSQLMTSIEVGQWKAEEWDMIALNLH